MTTLANPAPPPLIAALMESRHYPYPATTIELIETHISWVLLAGEFAYKIKKPVALGFLNFSTLEARRHFCDEELRLNRAIAPQLYLEVLPITGTPAAPSTVAYRLTCGNASSTTPVIVMPGLIPARAAGMAPAPHIRTLNKSRTEVVFRTEFIRVPPRRTVPIGESYVGAVLYTSRLWACATGWTLT